MKGGKVSVNVSATKGAKILSQENDRQEKRQNRQEERLHGDPVQGEAISVTSTAKYRYSYENKMATFAYMGQVKDSACTVTSLSALRTIKGFSSAPEGEAKDIEWTCTGNFDGKVSGSGLLYPETSVNTALGWGGTKVFAVTVDGMGTFANPKLTATVKKVKFTYTFLGGQDAFQDLHSQGHRDGQGHPHGQRQVTEAWDVCMPLRIVGFR